MDGSDSTSVTHGLENRPATQQVNAHLMLDECDLAREFKCGEFRDAHEAWIDTVDEHRGWSLIEFLL